MGSFLSWLRQALSGASAAPAETSLSSNPRFGQEPPIEIAPHLSLVPLLHAAGFGGSDAWAKDLHAPMRVHSIRGPRRVAAFLATIGHESNGGRHLEELLSYSAERLLAVAMESPPGSLWRRSFPDLDTARLYARKPKELADVIYGGRMGNSAPGMGFLYRGRGLIQITGFNNYRDAENALGLPLVKHPEMAAEPKNAAMIAAWWWASNGCNELADDGEVDRWRRRVNGGLKGLADVRRRYFDVLAAIGNQNLGA